MKPEAAFRMACIHWLKLRFGRHFWSVKILGGLGQRPGIPDDLCCIRGRFFGFEWKDPGRKPRIGPKQALEIDSIRQAGGQAFVIARFDDLEEAVRDVEPVQLNMPQKASKLALKSKNFSKT